MKNNIFKAKIIINLILFLAIVFVSMPITVYALEGTNGHDVTAEGSYKIEGTLSDPSVLVYTTPQGGDVTRTKGSNSDDEQQYTATANNNWEFYRWYTWYEGTTVNSSNHNFTVGDIWYFSKPNVQDEVFTPSSRTIQVNGEWDCTGTFYLYAIFRPKVTLQMDTINTTSISDRGTDAADYASAQSGRVEQYVKYKGETQMFAAIPWDRTLVSVTINGQKFDGYDKEQYEQNKYIIFKLSVQKPTNIDIKTRLEIQKVVFDANGGTGEMATQNFNNGEADTLLENKFKRKGYAFTGWNTNADGSGTDYSDKQSATFTPENDGDTITLYAQWQKLPSATIKSEPKANKLTYNTKQQALVSEGIANGGTIMYSLEENSNYTTDIPKATDVGNYIVYYFVVGDDNHNDSQKASVKVEIAKADPVIGTVSANVVNNTTDISAVVLERTDETVEGSLIIDEGQSLNLGNNEITYTFTPNDTDNYNKINGKINVIVVDTIPPEGIVKFTDADNVWKSIPEAITFELYFNNNQKIVVEANDSFSGIQKVEYYETSDTLDLEGVKAIDENKWILMEEEIVTIAEDAKQFIYYIRITDKSGNIAYLATNGAEFDTTAPSISGVIDGKTYYTSQKVTVTDKNLNTVMLNGKIVSDTFILEGDKEKIYTIIATDKAGNTTTFTVNMKKIEENEKPIIDIENEKDSNEVNNTNKSPNNNPQTGDNIILYVAILVISLIGLSVTTKQFGKQNKK